MALVNDRFSKWATGFSGCDGGDIGSPHSKSIWYCGIEWGGGHPDDEHELINKVLSNDVEFPSEGYTSDDSPPGWLYNLAYRFNWQAMKLLTAVSGDSITSYKVFAEKVKPFTKGEKGYFKMNLYPLAFVNTSHDLWKNGFAKATGLDTKKDYHDWIKANRFPIMKTWMDTYSPKLIICVGKSYLPEFSLAFFGEELTFESEIIDDRELSWAVNKNGTIMVVLPFLGNRNGLNKNVSIQKFGDRIRELLTTL
ncbi:hypothetical protein [Methylotenera sp.]|uniref:hypothetical protein n=1 Tax=Methylotenera sp. TaxID=2051956 RepID=UPI0027248AB8|nr:hypothetical protein [Methylotenera sp.]MDO9206559.1 hypothetical protein [Methylotenera sp.]MDP3308832.1 hypothetical protein [Methylotenera sp.]